MSALSESTQRSLPIFAAQPQAAGRNAIAANHAGASLGKSDKSDAASSFANLLKSRLHKEKTEKTSASATATSATTAAGKSSAASSAPAAATLPHESEIVPGKEIAALLADSATDSATPASLVDINDLLTQPVSDRATPPAAPNPDITSVSTALARPATDESLALADSQDFARLRALLASISNSAATASTSDADTAIEEAIPSADSPDVAQLRALLASASNSAATASANDSATADSATEDAYPIVDSPDAAYLRALLASVANSAAATGDADATIEDGLPITDKPDVAQLRALLARASADAAHFAASPSSDRIESAIADSADSAELSARFGAGFVATPTSDRVSDARHSSFDSDEISTEDALRDRSPSLVSNDALLANAAALTTPIPIDPSADSASESLADVDSYAASTALSTSNTLESAPATRLPMAADLAANAAISTSADSANATQALPSPTGPTDLEAPTPATASPAIPTTAATESQLSAAKTPPVVQAAASQKGNVSAAPTASPIPAQEIPPTPLSTTQAPPQESIQAVANAVKPASVSTGNPEAVRKSTSRNETTATSLPERAAASEKLADALTVSAAKTAETPDGAAPHSGDTLPLGDFRAAMEQANAAAQTAPATPAPTEPLPIETPLGQSGWDEEIGQKLTWMTNNEQHKAELVLTPPNMGRIEVSLTVDGDQVSAIFTSPHAAVREALENSLDRLREQMADAGVVLGNTQVGGESPQQSSQHSANRHERHGHFRFGKKPDGQYASSLDATVAQATTARNPGIGRRGLVDIFA